MRCRRILKLKRLHSCPILGRKQLAIIIGRSFVPISPSDLSREHGGSEILSKISPPSPCVWNAHSFFIRISISPNKAFLNLGSVPAPISLALSQLTSLPLLNPDIRKRGPGTMHSGVNSHCSLEASYVFLLIMCLPRAVDSPSGSELVTVIDTIMHSDETSSDVKWHYIERYTRKTRFVTKIA